MARRTRQEFPQKLGGENLTIHISFQKGFLFLKIVGRVRPGMSLRQTVLGDYQVQRVLVDGAF
jgi:hypothetical protein